MTRVTTVRLEDDLSNKLDSLAASMDRPKAWVIEQALRNYVDEQSWQVGSIREAMQDYRSGKAELVPHEQVMDEIQEVEAEIKASLQL